MRLEINLLPASYFEAQKKRQRIILGILAGVLVAVGFIGFNVWKFAQAARLAKQIQAIEEEQKKFETVLAEIDRIRQQQAQVDEREKLVKELLTHQSQWPAFMTSLLRAIPPTVWLKTIKNNPVGTKRSFTVEGRALSKQAVADFLRQVASHVPKVESANLVQITEPSQEVGSTTFQVVFVVSW